MGKLAPSRSACKGGSAFLRHIRPASGQGLYLGRLRAGDLDRRSASELGLIEGEKPRAGRSCPGAEAGRQDVTRDAIQARDTARADALGQALAQQFRDSESGKGSAAGSG
jgi:hypothetical protein